MYNEYIRLGIQAKRQHIDSLPNNEQKVKSSSLDSDIDLCMAVIHEHIDIISKLLEYASTTDMIEELGCDIVTNSARMVESLGLEAREFHLCIGKTLKDTVEVAK